MLYLTFYDNFLLPYQIIYFSWYPWSLQGLLFIETEVSQVG